MKTHVSMRTLFAASLLTAAAFNTSFAQTSEWKTTPTTPLAATAPTAVPALVPIQA